MRADQAVGRGAADEIGAGEEPEVPECTAPQRAEGKRPDSFVARRLGLAGLAIGHEADVRGRSRKISATSGRMTQPRRRSRPGAPVTAVMLAITGETKLPGRGAADRMPMTRPRRAVNQRAAIRREHGGRKPVPEPTRNPHIRMSCQGLHQRVRGDADDDERAQHRTADAEPLHHRGGERADAAIEDQVDRHRERDRGARPVELLLQRHHQDAGSRADAGAG